MENPFVIFPETSGLYARRAEELKAIVAERKSAQAAWRKKIIIAVRVARFLCRKTSCA